MDLQKLSLRYFLLLTPLVIPSIYLSEAVQAENKARKNPTALESASSVSNTSFEKSRSLQVPSRTMDADFVFAFDDPLY